MTKQPCLSWNQTRLFRYSFYLWRKQISLKENSKNIKFVAKTLFGLETVLAEELKNIGADNIEILHRAVSFTGEQKLMYEANLKLRTALRILKRVFTFKATSDAELYKKVQEVYWDKYFDAGDTIAIDSAVSSNYFTHSQFVSQRVKDAIVDQFRSKSGKRPSVDLEHPKFRINIHIVDNICTLSLDSSGESLHKRGYRLQMSEAPLSEVLAAGMILLSGWDGKKTFIDPMCGSGTIIFEAALFASKIPPGIFREHFGFMSWRDYDEQLWKKIVDDSKENISLFTGKIIGADISGDAIAAAKRNSKTAEFDNDIQLLISAFENFDPPTECGIVMMNPPYGERLKQDDITSFYKMIGDTLKKKYAGYDAWILSANMEALKFVGLHPSKKIALMNGQLECKFQKYSIYAGSKK